MPPPNHSFRSARTIEARFRLLGPDSRPVGPHTLVRTNNLGAGGAFLRTDEPHPVGTHLWIELMLPPPTKWITTLGEVRWLCERDEDRVCGMGVKFTGLSADDLAILGDFLATQTGRFSAT